jgi:hypothetical protein
LKSFLFQIFTQGGIGLYGLLPFVALDFVFIVKFIGLELQKHRFLPFRVALSVNHCCLLEFQRSSLLFSFFWLGGLFQNQPHLTHKILQIFVDLYAIEVDLINFNRFIFVFTQVFWELTRIDVGQKVIQVCNFAKMGNYWVHQG